MFIRGNSKQGVPMLCHDGSFGTICDENFDVNDAKVICRMLGYPTEGQLNILIEEWLPAIPA